MAFGIPDVEDQRIASELAGSSRGGTQQLTHIQGLYLPSNTPLVYTRENSFFNAITSGRAVDLAMDLLAVSEAPPKAYNR